MSDRRPVRKFGKRSTAEEVSAGIDLSGRHAIVTGANSGIGFEAAKALAIHGAHVIVASRSQERGEIQDRPAT